VTTLTEHKCVLDSCRQLETQGMKVTYLPVQGDGLVDLEELEASLTDRTVLVSVMMANNEIGVLQPIKEIGAMTRARKIFLHTDAAQAVGKVPVDVRDLGVDVMSISGHKLYGPKGVGALYVGRRPRVRIQALQSGGGQERGMRSGTVPTTLAVGLGAAARVAREELDRDHRHTSALANYFRSEIERRIPEVVFNGHSERRIPGNVNVSFAHVEGESLLMGIKNVAVSSGSACTSASLEPSYVLRAIGTDEALAHSSIRFGIGRFTTREEVDYTLNLLQREVERLREMSPLWEMHQEGIDIKTIQWTQDH
jgi:cysteine desulfurase